MPSDFNYSNDKCSIKNCSNKHNSLLLCKKHYQRYITDEKIKKIQTNVYRNNFGVKTKRDYLRNYLYGFIHYSTAIHLYYIEHFPLESIFIYHSKSIYKENQQEFTIDEFIKDFNYSENHEINDIKLHFDQKSYADGVKKFTATKEKNKIKNRIYLISFTIFIIILYASYHYSYQLHNNRNYVALSIIFFLFFSIVKSGLDYTETIKSLFEKLLKGKMYVNAIDNEKIIKKSSFLINRLYTRHELRYGIFGIIISNGLIFVVADIYTYWNKSFIYNAINSTLIICSTFMILIIYSVMSKNLSSLLITRRFHNAEFNLKLYSLNKESGIKTEKYYFRKLLIYNFFVIITSLFSFYLMMKYKVAFFYILLFSYYVNWNFVSTFFIFKMNFMYSSQFKKLIILEKKKLDESTAKDRFEKFRFLENLKLNFLYDNNSLKAYVKYLIPFIISYIIMKKDNFIFNLLKSIWNKLEQINL